MKFRAHDTFFIRKGWLSKGMKAVHSKPDVFVAKDENPMDVLGIGSNMVKSLRYWLVATNLTKKPFKINTAFRSSRDLEIKYSRMIALWRSTEHSTSCIICYQKMKKMRQHGISSSMNSICPNLCGKILSQPCRTMFP